MAWERSSERLKLSRQSRCVAAGTQPRRFRPSCRARALLPPVHPHCERPWLRAALRRTQEPLRRSAVRARCAHRELVTWSGAGARRSAEATAEAPVAMGILAVCMLVPCTLSRGNAATYPKNQEWPFAAFSREHVHGCTCASGSACGLYSIGRPWSTWL